MQPTFRLPIGQCEDTVLDRYFVQVF